MRLTRRVERLEARTAELEAYRLAHRLGEQLELDPQKLIRGAEELGRRLDRLRLLGLSEDEALVQAARELDGIEVDPVELRARAKELLEDIRAPKR